MRPRSLRLSFVLVAALVALPGGATAASPHQVDPSTMTPPLNPAWDPWTCTDTGSGPVCRAEHHEAWADAETGLECGGTPILTTGRFDSDAVRWHLPDGRAIRTQFHQQVRESWTLAGDPAGPSLAVRASFTEHYVYPVPGDRTTRLEHWTGIDWHATSAGTGLVWHDTGYIGYEPGTGQVIDVIHGPADSGHGDLDRVLPEICAALGA